MAEGWGISRAEADNIGMLGTIMNALMLRGALTARTDADVRVMTAVPIHSVAEPFIRLFNPGHVPDLRGVARTNFCDLGVAFDAKSGRGVIISAIDNLVKGAAGQAVQNMNLMLGYPETEALL